MRTVLFLLLWPFVAAFRFGLEALIWFRPSLGQGRRAFPESIRQLIEQAKSVEVHCAELGSEEPPEPEQLGTKFGWRSLGMVRLDSQRDRRRVIRSVLRANRESLGGFLCLDAEYGLRFESELGRADLMICFECMQVWVWAGTEITGDCYPISWRPKPLLERLLRAQNIAEPAPREERLRRRLTGTTKSAEGTDPDTMANRPRQNE